MTPKERAAMQQALEALEAAIRPSYQRQFISRVEAISALREALAERKVLTMTQEEMVDAIRSAKIEQAELDTKAGELYEMKTKLWKSEQAEQEPVAWGRVFDGDIIDCICPEEHALNEGDYTIPLYAAPVRTKDLTDDEIYTLYSEPCSDREMVEFARAVIAADRELNK